MVPGCLRHEPTHCPFDYYIIENLGIKGLPPWTRITNIDQYGELVRQARENCGEVSLAEG